jgi:PHD/YefM family antitoxin component YafN of YafNO toxin-antitoxin module
MTKKLVLRESQAAYNLSLDDLELGQETVIIERNGQELAAIVPIEEYRRLKSASEPSPPEPQDEKLRTFYEDKEMFQRLLSELLKTHKGKFVAVFHGQIVDVDSDLGTLARRVYKKYGYQPIYMDEVLEEPRVYEFPSPEIIR